MTILTHIHENNVYGLAILITCSLGCSNIASHLYSRWFAHSKINVISIHAIVKLCIVLWGMLFISWRLLFDTAPLLQFGGVFSGIILGWIAVNIELYINRKLVRHAALHVNHRAQYRYHRKIENKAQGMMKKIISQKVNLRNVQEHHARLDGELNNYQLRDIILVAIFEEILFRGYLYQLGLYCSSLFLTIIVWLTTTILFGASHITLGKGQFLSKTILGSICLLSVVIFHSLLPAIVIHVFFNLFAYREMMQASTFIKPVYRSAV
jgi:hypothetical protein